MKENPNDQSFTLYVYKNDRQKGEMILYTFFGIIAELLMPIFCISFCLNLVSIIKKAVNKEDTARNTFWLTFSFIVIVWSISLFAPLY